MQSTRGVLASYLGVASEGRTLCSVLRLSWTITSTEYDVIEIYGTSQHYELYCENLLEITEL